MSSVVSSIVVEDNGKRNRCIHEVIIEVLQQEQEMAKWGKRTKFTKMLKYRRLR